MDCGRISDASERISDGDHQGRDECAAPVARAAAFCNDGAY